MSRVRATLRAGGLLTWSLAFAAALGFARAFGQTQGERARRTLFRLWARVTVRLIGLDVRPVGRPPSGTHLLVSNHLSYLDIVVLASLIEADFVAKAEVADWPLVGALCRAVDTVFIDRSRKRDLLRVLGVLRSRLEAGRSIVVFPEGTTSDGSRVLPFKSSLFAAAARTAAPTQTVSLTYRTPPGTAHPSLAVCWWGEMTFLRHVLALLSLPRIEACVAFAPATLFDANRKLLARSAERAVRRHFRAVSQAEVDAFQGELSCPVPMR